MRAARSDIAEQHGRQRPVGFLWRRRGCGVYRRRQAGRGRRGKGDRDGREVTLVFLGLSHANLDKLKGGYPIKFNGEAIGLGNNTEFFIFAGESERSMKREFMKFVGSETKVHIDPKLKD